MAARAGPALAAEGPVASPVSAAGWTDSHCHLQDVSAPEEALARAVAAGVSRVVVASTDAASSQRAIELAVVLSGSAHGASYGQARLPAVSACVGLHPHHADQGLAAVREVLVGSLGSSPGTVVAVGECGLDYHYDYSPRPEQRTVFAEQVALAAAHGLALVVHTRDAWDDTFAILEASRDHPGPASGSRASGSRAGPVVFHCFTGGPEEARRALEMGAWLSVSGMVTFKGAGSLREAVAACPLDRLLVETDTPYLSPVPFRGRPNEPANVAVVGRAVADLVGATEAELARVTTANAASVFGPPEPPWPGPAPAGRVPEAPSPGS